MSKEVFIEVRGRWHSIHPEGPDQYELLQVQNISRVCPNKESFAVIVYTEGPCDTTHFTTTLKYSDFKKKFATVAHLHDLTK